MEDHEVFRGHIQLTLDQPEAVARVAHALSSPLRVRILQLLCRENLNIKEMAELLNEPVSTVAFNVSVLEKAKFITSEQIPGARGMMKRCTKLVHQLDIGIVMMGQEALADRAAKINMPIGAYSCAGELRGSCGLATADHCIGNSVGDPCVYFSPERIHAQLAWLGTGYLEYHFHAAPLKTAGLKYLSLTFEACSEAVGYDNTLKSDIYVSINDVELGIWESPGDFGDRRGLLTPDWWPVCNTQHGQVHTWQVTEKGTFLDTQKLSDVTLDQLALEQNDHVKVRIGVHADAKHPGGLNLFGESFGDFPFGLVFEYGF